MFNSICPCLSIANLASQALYFRFPPEHAPAETLVQAGHVTPQNLGCFQLVPCMLLREEWLTKSLFTVHSKCILNGSYWCDILYKGKAKLPKILQNKGNKSGDCRMRTTDSVPLISDVNRFSYSRQVLRRRHFEDICVSSLRWLRILRIQFVLQLEDYNYN